jgi:hypothetical protein
MRIAYLTTDEVNLDLARRMAAAHGLTLCLLTPKDLPPAEEFDAVLFDLDYSPVGQRPEVLAKALVSHPLRPMVVHGYNLRADQANTLRRKRIAVYRRLRPRVFRFLRRALHITRAATAPGCDRKTGTLRICVATHSRSS